MVITMRIYYIFLIKKEIYEITKNKPGNLYKLLESIYLLNNDDVVLGFKMFDKICKIIPKKNFNKLISDTNIESMSYTTFGSTHMINDFLNNETTKLIINNSHIKIKSNTLYPSFFGNLENIPYLFVCDFINMDYFYLKDVSLKSTAR